ncbi:MAG: SIS domain-containing protein, partial [Brevundimonas sp.]|nr:SIS domain-containing protein [Brevundimonas sp.]
MIRVEARALTELALMLDEQFSRACETICKLNRQLVVTGMGKSGHIARKIAATFAATGTPAIYIHPGEASHGDLGMLVTGDVLLVLSNSGNTTELQAILTYARKNQIQIIGVAAR